MNARVDAGVPAGGQFKSVSHAEPQLTLKPPVDPDVAEHLEKMREAGLNGAAEPYTGGNPDVPEGALNFKAEGSQYELVLSKVGTPDFTIQHLDPYEERTFTVSNINGANAKDSVEAIQFALWEMDAEDAASSHFYSGDVYEVRESSIGVEDYGHLIGTIVTRDDEDNWLTLSHNYTTGQTSVMSEDGRLMTEGPAYEGFVESMVIDLGTEPEDGNYVAAAQAGFAGMLDKALKSPFVPIEVRKAGQTKA